MKNLFREINGLYDINVYYSDTDSLYREKKSWDVLNKAGFLTNYVNVETIRNQAVYFTR